MNKMRWFLAVCSVLASIAAVPMGAQATSSMSLLTGTIRSTSGSRMAGVTVSAKAVGETITTTVFTDEKGNYYFPRLQEGMYRVWAQADSYQTEHSQVKLNQTNHQDFILRPMEDFEQQLTGDQLLSSLPEDTPDDRRLKRVFRNNCSGCHQPNYILQNRFDEEGWTAILNLMERVNVLGIYLGPEVAPKRMIDFHKKELVAYLTRMRGPGTSAMKFKLRPRPSGEAARVVFTEYDVPLDPMGGYETEYATNDGSDWSLGTPSGLFGNRGVHDAQADLNGNIWFATDMPSPDFTIAKIDPATGRVKSLKVPGANGMAAIGHGITRDAQGILWFNLRGVPGRLARIDPSTEKVDIFTPPNGMQGVGDTVDVDGKGYIWATTNPGAIRFDPKTQQFTEFKSPTYKNQDGTGNTYGLAADRDGNAWWAQMSIDIVAKSDVETGKAEEVKLPHVPGQMELTTTEEQQMYAATGTTWDNAVPWTQGPRRLGADRNGNIVWVCDFWGGNLARIDTHTLNVTLVPLPRPDAQMPYQAAVDSSHNVWVNVMNADEILKFDPKTSHWTEYPLPTLGTESRYISLLEQNGALQVIVPYFRVRKVARMTLRSKESLEAIQNQVRQQDSLQARTQ